MAEYNIVIDTDGNPDPATLICKSGDRITWTNKYPDPLVAFVVPTCVSPQTSPAPVPTGATTGAYTVKSGVNGNFGYSYRWPTPNRDTRGGAIDVI